MRRTCLWNYHSLCTLKVKRLTPSPPKKKLFWSQKIKSSNEIAKIGNSYTVPKGEVLSFNGNYYVFAPVVCRRLVSYLYLFAYAGVCHVLCFCSIFLRLVCPVLPVSMDCPILVAPSVFSNVY